VGEGSDILRLYNKIKKEYSDSLQQDKKDIDIFNIRHRVNTGYRVNYFRLVKG